MPTVLASWTAHPARRRPRDLALVVAVVAITMAVVLTSFESLPLALLAGAVLAIAVAPFLLPTRYVVTDEAIEVARGLRRVRRRFADLRRVEIGDELAVLSPFPTPRRLDRFRALVVFLDGADRERVAAILRARVRP